MERHQKQNPKARIAVIAAFLLLPFLSLSIWHWATATSDTEDKLQQVVEKYGYYAVAPPSRLFGPGTFTTVEKLSNGNLKLHPTCIMDDASLAAKWLRSRTVQENLFHAIEQTFESSAKVVNVSQTNAAGKRVKGFNFSLRDIYVITISDEGLNSLRRQYLKGAWGMDDAMTGGGPWNAVKLRRGEPDRCTGVEEPVSLDEPTHPWDEED